MAGIAIKILGANFSASGLGHVTLKGSAIPVTAITINGSSSVTDSGQYSAVLTPSNTTQTRVVWSITSGSTYASIDQNGLVTAKDGANNNSVTIKCASADNPSVYKTKTISVTKSATATPTLTSPTIDSLDLGTIASDGTSVNQTVTVRGQNITQPLTVTVSGTGFSANASQIKAAQALAGYGLKLTYTNNGTSAVQQATGSVRIQSTEGIDKTITLTAAKAAPDQPVSGLVTDGLINNFDAYHTKTAEIIDQITNNPVTFNGNVGENCIVINENDMAYCSNDVGTTMAMLNGLSTWTLEYIIEATGWTADNCERTLYHDVSSGAGQGKMQISLGKIGSNTNGAVFVRYSNTWKSFVFDQDTLRSINWSKAHVINITREASQSGMTYNLYVDGALLASASGTQASNIATFAGAVNIMSTTGARKLFALRAYNKALTLSEIAQNYQYNVERYDI